MKDDFDFFCFTKNKIDEYKNKGTSLETLFAGEITERINETTHLQLQVRKLWIAIFILAVAQWLVAIGLTVFFMAQQKGG